MSDALVRCLRNGLRERADAKVAAGQQAYMRDIQPFRGVKTPLRRALLKDCLARHPLSEPEAYRRTIETLWQGRYREEKYLALDVAANVSRFRTREALPLYETLLATADWWDVLDPLAGDLIGGVLRGHPALLKRKVRAWRRGERMWTRRAALLVQLKHRGETNTALLAETVLALSGEKDFFIRKAIGWALREYSKTYPLWVKRFVDEHEDRLSALSRREALKHIADQDS